MMIDRDDGGVTVSAARVSSLQGRLALAGQAGGHSGPAVRCGGVVVVCAAG